MPVLRAAWLEVRLREPRLREGLFDDVERSVEGAEGVPECSQQSGPCSRIRELQGIEPDGGLTVPSSGRQARGTRTGRFRNVQGPWPDTTPEADGASVRRL